MKESSPTFDYNVNGVGSFITWVYCLVGLLLIGELEPSFGGDVVLFGESLLVLLYCKASALSIVLSAACWTAFSLSLLEGEVPAPV